MIKAILSRPDGDARRIIEGYFLPSRERLRDRTDRRLRELDERLDRESEDPLAHIWTGNFWVFDQYAGQWRLATGVQVT